MLNSHKQYFLNFKFNLKPITLTFNTLYSPLPYKTTVSYLKFGKLGIYSPSASKVSPVGHYSST